MTFPTVGEERADFSASFTCNYVVSVRRIFLFLLVLGIGCVIFSDAPWAFNIIIFLYYHICFSTLYTMLPQDLIKNQLTDLIERTFKRDEVYIWPLMQNGQFSLLKNTKI